MEMTLPIMEKFINELNVSEELKNVCKENGWDNLQAITAMPVYILMEKPGMTSRMIAELFGYLKKEGLEEEWKEE